MTCIEVDNFIEMHDKPHNILTVVDKTSVHRQVFYGVAICVRSFEFTTGVMNPTEPHSASRHILEASRHDLLMYL